MEIILYAIPGFIFLILDVLVPNQISDLDAGYAFTGEQ
jgi:hypothetical protein